MRFGTKQWSADDGGWHDVDPAGTADQVIAEVYQRLLTRFRDLVGPFGRLPL